MERKTSWPERWDQHIDHELFSIAMDLKRGTHPYLAEYGSEFAGDWKLVRYLRHKASIALAYSPNRLFDENKARQYVLEHPEESPLMKGEAKIISKYRFILPDPAETDVPKIKKSYGTGDDMSIPLGPITENYDHLRWFEPSWPFVLSRIGDELDSPDRIVGATSGKWRMLSAYHVLFLWKMRNNCDFMTVACDSEKYDAARGSDSFNPTFEDKIASLGALRFPDGSGIDLVTKTHLVDYNDWFGGVYLPFGVTGDSWIHDADKIKEQMKEFRDSYELALLKVHLNISPRESDRLLRLRYFLSNRDEMFEEKRFAAATRGIPTSKVLVSQGGAHVSDLVKRLNITS